MPPKYIFRLDDASEFMDYSKWDRFFKVFDYYGVKPIIAVIPFNKDPKMTKREPDDGFWVKMKCLQEKGYHIGLHGYEHLYSTKKSGIIGMNKYSEFAGIPLEKQIQMLKTAVQKFNMEGITSNLFVAPAHSFDKNTIKALKSATNIKFISDGFYKNPVARNGLMWIPQQLWEPRIKSSGVWTICYHPETSDDAVINSLDLFLQSYNKYSADPFSLNFSEANIDDIFFWNYMKFYVKLRTFYYSLKRKAGK